MTPLDSTPSVPRPLPAADVFGLPTATIGLRSGRTAYFDVGQGPPVLLLHGAPMTAVGFARVMRTLAPHHRVLAPDMPGFGGSAAGPGFDGSLSAYAAFIVEFCETLDLRDLVVYVNDTSGCIGLCAMAQLQSRVRGIVIADTVPLPLTGRAWLAKFVIRYLVTSWPMRALNRRLNLLPWLVAHVAPLWHPVARQLRGLMTAQFDTADKRDRVIDVLRHVADDESFLRRAAASAAALSRCPALILFGQFDPMRMLGGERRWRHVFPQSTSVVIPYEEHFPMLGSGERVAAAVHAWMGGIPAEVAHER